LDVFFEKGIAIPQIQFDFSWLLNNQFGLLLAFFSTVWLSGNPVLP